MLIKEKTQDEIKAIELFLDVDSLHYSACIKLLYTQDLEEKNFVQFMYRVSSTKLYACDLGYHSDTPTYEGQMRHDCCYTKQGYCYYDGSSLNAQDLLDKHKGSETFHEDIFKELKDYYEWRFKNV